MGSEMCIRDSCSTSTLSTCTRIICGGRCWSHAHPDCGCGGAWGATATETGRVGPRPPQRWPLLSPPAARVPSRQWPDGNLAAMVDEVRAMASWPAGGMPIVFSEDDGVCRHDGVMQWSIAEPLMRDSSQMGPPRRAWKRRGGPLPLKML